MKVRLHSYKSKRKNRIKIDGFDLWNLDMTLSKIIYPALVKLKDNNHGIPYVEDSDVNDDYVTESMYKVPDDVLESRWNYVMDEMIFAHERIAYADLDNTIEEDNRITNGLRLFGKYYQALWD